MMGAVEDSKKNEAEKKRGEKSGKYAYGRSSRKDWHYFFLVGMNFNEYWFAI